VDKEILMGSVPLMALGFLGFALGYWCGRIDGFIKGRKPFDRTRDAKGRITGRPKTT
jgi:hypothetical protein